MMNVRFVVAYIAAVGVLPIGGAVASADPSVPAPAPPPGPTVPLLGPLGASGSLTDLLGQNPIPAVPGGPPGTLPDLDALNNAYVLPQNEVPAAPGQGAAVGVPPGAENADLGRIDYLRQLHELHANGNLRGALLGQLPPAG